MFDTLLIANRGEIACRIIRTARKLGLRTVAVYSDADRDALHVREADLAVGIGPSPARDSYLDIGKLVEAARATGAGAIHPGYGFLSENADFARACEAAGLVFVGPPAGAIDALGNKSAAKRLAERIGVPCLPGYSGTDQADATLIAQARRIGAPLMIKAAAGGGGRGMRRCDDVKDEAALNGLLQAARNEAAASFGNGDLLIERLVESARHVEVQVFGDRQGHCVYLGERDCSTQRRNQKILEEAPAPGVDPALRERMGEAATLLAREVGYVGAGTIEFLLAPDGQFYFLEMNTRLQVEHPVTEAITGLDLVEWQLRVAQGEPLPLAQDEIRLHGHSIEARLCAEDAFGGFVPQSGAIHRWQAPSGDGIRVDHGLTPSAQIPPYYDSMIAKIICTADTREQARNKLIAALRETTVFGVITNRDYLLRCLQAPAFRDAQLSTRWLTDQSAGWKPPAAGTTWLAAAAALRVDEAARAHGALANWHSTGPHTVPVLLTSADKRHALSVSLTGPHTYRVDVGGKHHHRVEIEPAAGPSSLTRHVRLDGRRTALRSLTDGARGWLDFEGCSLQVDDAAGQPPQRKDASAGGTVTSRMHGMVVNLAASVGQKVERGQFLLAIEAMKMEHRIEAPIAGTVAEVGTVKGQQVAPGRLLVRIEPAG